MMTLRGIGRLTLVVLLCFGIESAIVPARSAVKIAQNQDSSRSNAQRLLEQARQASNPQSAIALYQQARKQFQAINDRQGEGEALRELAYTYSILCQDQQVISTIQQGISLAKTISPEFEMTWMETLSEFYEEKGLIAQAVQMQQQILSIAQVQRRNIHTARALMNLGRLHERKNDQIALQYYQQSLRQLEQDRQNPENYNRVTSPSLSDVLTQLIRIYQRLGDARRADFLTLQLTEEQLRQSRLSFAAGMVRQSNSLSGTAKLQILQKAFSYYQSLDYLPGQVVALYGLASESQRLNQPRRAIEFSQKALEIVEKVGADNVPMFQPKIELLSLIVDSYVALRETQAFIKTAPQLSQVVRKAYPRLYETVQRRLISNYKALGETQKAEAALKELNQFLSTPLSEPPLPPPKPLLGAINFSDSTTACRSNR